MSGRKQIFLRKLHPTYDLLPQHEKKITFSWQWFKTKQNSHNLKVTVEINAVIMYVWIWMNVCRSCMVLLQNQFVTGLTLTKNSIWSSAANLAKGSSLGLGGGSFLHLFRFFFSGSWNVDCPFFKSKNLFSTSFCLFSQKSFWLSKNVFNSINVRE